MSKNPLHKEFENVVWYLITEWSQGTAGEILKLFSSVKCDCFVIKLHMIL